MRLAAICAVLGLAAGASAQDAARPDHVLQVMGIGKVSTKPDIAVIDYWAAGEGKTPDDASSALSARQKAITEGVSGLLKGEAAITNSNLVVIAVRGAQCENGAGYNGQPRLNDGACAIVGYLATIQGTIRTSQIDRSGTAVGLASRLGARDARLQNFLLSDNQSAYRAAMAAAIADAKRQAQMMAGAAGEKLGPIIVLRDQNYRPTEDIVVTGARVSAPPPPPAPRAPVAIDVNPRPIETSAQVYVTFAIES